MPTSWSLRDGDENPAAKEFKNSLRPMKQKLVLTFESGIIECLRGLKAETCGQDWNTAYGRS